MYLAWTFAVAVAYPRWTLGRYSAGPGRARPPHGGGLLTVFTFTRGAGLGGGERLRLARGRGPCRGHRAGGPGPRGHAGCRCRVLARERCPANAPGRGRRLDRHREDVATYRGRVRRPRAGLTASPLSRPVRPAPLPERRAAGRVPGAGTGDGQRKRQTV